MKALYTHPSFYAHVMNGILIAIALIILYMNFGKVKSFGIYEILIIVLLFATVIGIHGISHLGLEREYDFYPLPWIHDNLTYNVA